MNSRRIAKAIGWALAYYLGSGLLFLVCAGFLLAFVRLPEPPDTVRNLMLGIPLLFPFVAVFHEFTGKLPRTNHALRTTALFVLWPLSFYFVTLALVSLVLILPNLGSDFGVLIFAPALVGGFAGSLCWRGKLPGTRAIRPSHPPQTPDQYSGQRGEEDECRQAV
jgi:uncharacterized membrane protein (GlpM family)